MVTLNVNQSTGLTVDLQTKLWPPLRGLAVPVACGRPAHDQSCVHTQIWLELQRKRWLGTEDATSQQLETACLDNL